MHTHEKDIYDLEVERLTKEPEDIPVAWTNSLHLFKMIGRGSSCGCLTMIHSNSIGANAAYVKGLRNYQLEESIKADLNIPNDVDDITATHLPHFAKWQRRIDRMNAGESFEDVMKD